MSMLSRLKKFLTQGMRFYKLFQRKPQSSKTLATLPPDVKAFLSRSAHLPTYPKDTESLKRLAQTDWALRTSFSTEEQEKEPHPED